MRFMVIHNSNEANEAGIPPSKELIESMGKLLQETAQQGILLNIVVGIIGGFLGGWLLPALGLGLGGGWIGFLVTAFIGAVVLLLIVNLFTRGRAR